MMTSIVRTFGMLAVATGAMLLGEGAAAQGFAAVVSPPRFEIAMKAGTRVREVVEISNASSQPARYLLRTVDWLLDPEADISFLDELAADSCRPWIAIERREILVPAGGQYRFRFEVEPPAGTPDGECRFALMIEGEEQTVQMAGGLGVPVTGRIGVIVYVQVGEAAPELTVVGTMLHEAGGRSLPAVQVRNGGNAHGRLSGFLTGTDASGHKFEFAPSSLPILPGETRRIVLSASDGAKEPAAITYPVTIRGVLELGAGRRSDFEQQFSR